MVYEAAYLLPHKDHLVADLEAHGVATHLLDAPHDRDLGWVRRFRRLVDDGGFDVVHAHSPVPAASARLAIRAMPAARRPVFVYTEHNRWPSHSRATRTANAATFALNDATIAVSAEVRDSMAAPFRRDTSVIVHGIDLDAVAALAPPSARRFAPSWASGPTRCWRSPWPTSGRPRATRICWPRPTR